VIAGAVRFFEQQAIGERRRYGGDLYFDFRIALAPDEP